MMNPNGVITIFFLLGIFVSSLPPLQGNRMNLFSVSELQKKEEIEPLFLLAERFLQLR
jgi:hypothetical protein